MSRAISVIGEGMLSEAVRELLTDDFVLLAGGPLDFDNMDIEAAVILQDDWDPTFFRREEKTMQTAGVPWLGGYIDHAEAVLGPLVRPGTPGCSQCADQRRLNASRQQEMSGAELSRFLFGTKQKNVWATRSAVLHLSQMIAAEVRRVVQGEQALMDSRIFIIDMKTLNTTRHFFLPDPQCDICGHLHDDSEQEAYPLQSRSKPDAGTFRSRSLSNLRHSLRRDYFDERTGLFNDRIVQQRTPFADICINFPLYNQDQWTAGRSHSYQVSEMTALLEGLERCSGMTPLDKKTVIHDSYHQLAGKALDPVSVGLYSEEQYAQTDFPFQPFDPERDFSWVWGYSLRQERPLLIPESIAYYNTGYGEIVSETSNGCALGGSLEEAIFFGMLEVAERDAFLMTWYNRIDAPRLDPLTAGDIELILMLERMRAVVDYEVTLYNITMENEIPSILAIAKCINSFGPRIVCAAGAHPDPVKAAKSAVHEAAGMIPALHEVFDQNRTEYERMFREPSRVQRMEDHFLMHSLPEAEQRLSFLLENRRPQQSFQHAFKVWPKHLDLMEDVQKLLDIFRSLKLDVIAVNQTNDIIRRNGLYCVKIIIPGMLPMTFGHHLIRTTGLPRLYEIPVKLGYRKEPLAPEALNPYPHPFP